MKTNKLLSDKEMEEYLRDMDNAVLYDVFYEAGTLLSGIMVAIEREYRRRGNLDEAEKILNKDIALIKERASVGVDDVDCQIVCKIAWTRKTQELQEFLKQLKMEK